MSSAKQREKKYQAIRLYNSGVISLADIKAQFRIVATVADEEYSSPKDVSDALETKTNLEKIEKLTMTRDAAKQRLILKLNQKPRITANREETVAKFATQYRGGLPHNFVRYGILRSKSKRKNPPRHGSSKGKIARTRYHGFQKFNKDFDKLERGLLALLKDRRSARGISKNLRNLQNSIKVSATRGG